MKARVFAAAGALVLLAAACGGSGASQTVASRPGQFRLDEWSISADQPKLTAGRRTITAVNLGHHTHELVIVKATDAASLPTKADGSVDEAQLERVKVGEIADIPSGASHHKVLNLRPGSYVLQHRRWNGHGERHDGRHGTRSLRSRHAHRVHGHRMIRSRATGLVVVAIVAMSACGGSGSSATTARRAQVEARGTAVMSFDQNRTTHVFHATTTGGVQSVVVNDPPDPRQVTLIRAHLRKEASRFAAGDFTDPMAIHGMKMPGLEVLRRAAARVHVAYTKLPLGAKISYSTTESSLVTALHHWFDAQLMDHGSHAHR